MAIYDSGGHFAHCDGELAMYTHNVSFCSESWITGVGFQLGVRQCVAQQRIRTLSRSKYMIVYREGGGKSIVTSELIQLAHTGFMIAKHRVIIGICFCVCCGGHWASV